MTAQTDKTLSRAKAVATRRNNAFLRKVERTLPLFREEVLAGWEPDTAEQVLERRKKARENFREFWREFNKSEQEKIRKYRQECFELCSSKEEFFRLMRQQIKVFYGKSKRNRWYVLLGNLRERKTPLTELAEMVLAWLEQENEPVSHWDLWVTRGDGRSWKEISLAIQELEKKELVKSCPLKETIIKGEKYIGGSVMLFKKSHTQALI